MSWIVPENKLDEQQRNFIENFDLESKNVWIKGFPGSGKSVLLAYVIKKIKNEHPRAKVVVIVYTHSLIKMFRAALAEMGISVNVITYFSFLDSSEHYDYIISDEVQDMTPRVLYSMNSRSSHVIVAGDENQSIYDFDPKYREATVTTDQINAILSTYNYELGIIHRLSSSIINAVQKLMPLMNVFSSKRDLSKHSTQIRLCKADSKREQAEYILKEAQKAINIGQTAAILVPTHDCVLEIVQKIIRCKKYKEWNVSTNSYGKVDYAALNNFLSKKGIPLQYIGNGYGLFSEDSRKIIIMTYHSSKGLDFDNVFLPELDASLFISKNEQISKILFMVAMTRSRNNLYLIYSGKTPHSYIMNFSSDCSRISIHDYLTSQNSKINSNVNVFGF